MIGRLAITVILPVVAAVAVPGCPCANSTGGQRNEQFWFCGGPHQ